MQHWKRIIGTGLLVVGLVIAWRVRYLVIPRVCYWKTQVPVAKLSIDTLQLALSMYRYETGEYLVFGELSGNLNDASQQITLAEVLTGVGGGEVYLDPSPKVMSPDGRVFIDRWGMPYVCIYEGEHNRDFYDIYSFGPNRKDEKGEGDDIANWKF